MDKNNKDLRKLKGKLGKLSVKEKKDLITYLKNSYSVFEGERTDVKKCPHCNSNKIVKNGTRKNGHHKYICKDCKKNFTFRTGTVISSVQKLGAWNAFVEDFMSLHFSSLSELTKRLKISRQTAFNWRHKLLNALENNQIKFSSEIVEYDDVFMLLSRKGRQNMDISKESWYRKWRRHQVGESKYNTKIFVAYGRTSKQLDLTLATMGKVTKKSLEKYFTKDKFDNVTVHSDRHPSYMAFFDDANVQHHSFKASSTHVNWTNKDVHVQSLNAHVNGLKEFTNGYLKGVSTKYINSYLKWYMFIHEVKQFLNRKIELDTTLQYNIADTICDEIVNDKKGLGIYRRIECAYDEFLKENGRTNFGKCKNHYYANKMAG